MKGYSFKHTRKAQEKGLRKSSSSFFVGYVATGTSSMFLREQHAVQMEWIQEILSLRAENSSKMELGGKKGFGNQVNYHNFTFITLCDHSVLPLSSLYWKILSGGILMEGLNTALTKDSVVISLCIL